MAFPFRYFFPIVILSIICTISLLQYSSNVNNLITSQLTRMLSINSAVEPTQAPPEEPIKLPGNSDDKKTQLYLGTALFAILTLLLIFTILFEFLREKVEENVNEFLQPIVEAMFSELTVLGFIGLITFLLGRNWTESEDGSGNVLQMISAIVFADLPCPVEETCSEYRKTMLGEMFEDVHMMLFLVMILYILQVCILVFMGKRICREWEESERRCTHEKEKIRQEGIEFLRERDCQLHKRHHSCLRRLVHYVFEVHFSSVHVHEVKHDIEWLGLREAFIHPRDNTEMELPVDFDLSEYCKIIMGKTIAEIVEIPVKTWIFMEFIFAFFFLARVELPLEYLMVLMVGFGYVLNIFYYTLKRKLDNIRHALHDPREGHFMMWCAKTGTSALQLKELLESSKGRVRNSPLLHGKHSPMKAHIPSVQAEMHSPMKLSPLHTTINSDIRELRSPLIDSADFVSQAVPVPLYLANLPQPRRWLGHKILGRIPNKHEMCFWFDHMGAEFALFCVRVVVLLMSVYIALLVTQGKDLVPVGGYYIGVSVLIFGLIPIYLVEFKYTPHILRRLVLVTSIEMMKQKKVIQKVIRIVKTKKSLRSLKVLQNLKCQVRRTRPKSDTETAGRLESRVHLLAEETRMEIERTFKLFDKDGSGEIEASELRDLMGSLGHEMTSEESVLMVAELDINGDGSVSCQEFLEWMADQAFSEEQDPEELIHSIFSMFDKDGSGSITADEFQRVLESIGETLTIDEISDLVRELDEDGDGEIDFEEFAAMLRKHSIVG